MTPMRAEIAFALLVVGCTRDPAPAIQPVPEPSRSSSAREVVIAPPPSASAGEPASEPLPTSDSGACQVSVVRVIGAAVYRGPGVDSPMRQKSLESMPPEQRDRWRGRDHGVKHLACTYALRVSGKLYRYRHNGGQDFTNSFDLDPATCSKDETQREVEKEVRDFTKQCSDLHAGEYWGYRLDPLAE